MLNSKWHRRKRLDDLQYETDDYIMLKEKKKSSCFLMVGATPTNTDQNEHSKSDHSL